MNVSGRFLSILCALVGLAIVPTWIHSYADFTVQDGRVTSAIPEALAGYRSTPSKRNSTWGKRRFDSDDWTERLYAANGDEVKLTVIRSYDAKSLYHHPELAVAYGPSYVRSEVLRLADRPDVPVHTIYTDEDNGTVAMYVLRYDDRFVQDPILFQMRASGELLFSGRKPMTLFFVTDDHVTTAQARSLDTLPATKVLFAALDQFLAQAGSSR